MLVGVVAVTRGDPRRCDHCAEVIGVYEPVVAVEEAGPRETSRAAEPTLACTSSQVYHRACYLERFGSAPT